MEMKKFIPLKHGLIFIIIFSCGPADEIRQNDLQIYSMLLGKWYPVETLIDNVVYPYQGHESCSRDFTEFKDNEIVRTINVVQCVETLQSYGTFNLTHKTIIVTYSSSEIYSLEIEEITPSYLTLFYADSQNGDGGIIEIRTRYTRE